MDILVLAERSLLCLSESGNVRLQKRLDYQPLCGAAFASPAANGGSSGEHSLLVASHSGSLLVYKHFELVWAASLAEPAVCLAVGAFCAVPGLIVSATAKAQLSLSYLGTDPPSAAVGAEAKELNYEAMEEEHRRLLHAIREASSGTKPEPAESVSLRAQARRPARCLELSRFPA